MASTKPRARRAHRESSPTTSNPIEIAMEAEAYDAAPDSPARRLLVNQNRLIGWEIADKRASLALKLMTALAGAAAAIALGVMVWQASQARGLLVEPFSVPPDMAARGLTGQVVASHVLDQLARLEVEADAYRKPSSYSNDWGHDIKVAIPTTGVNLGELQGALRRWLGHETRISGEVYRTSTGLALAARTGGSAAFVAEGAEPDLDALTTAVAAEIYKATQPYRYGRLLTRKGDAAGAKAVLRQLALDGPDPNERAWGFRQTAWIASREGDPVEAARLAREALRLKPKMGPAFQILHRAEFLLGHGEAAVADCALTKRYLPLDRELEDWGRNARFDFGVCDERMADYAAALREFDNDRASPRQLSNVGFQLDTGAASSLVGLHEVSAAERRLADKTISKLTGEDAFLARARWAILRGRQDWPGLVAFAPEADLARAFGSTPRARVSSPEWLQLAYAKAMLGDQAGAAAMAAQTPADCDRCLTLRGQLASLAGDAPAADRWFAQAVKAAPSYPQPLFEWAEARAHRGELAVAIDLYRQAQAKAPRWADPIKREGDALAAQGDRAGALDRYAKAAVLAPRWGGLYLAWSQALTGKGDKIGAAAKLASAAGMDLTAPERAELALALGAR